MATDFTFDIGTLYAFLLVLARISGAFIFVPIPGIQAGPQIARALLAVSLTPVSYTHLTLPTNREV